MEHPAIVFASRIDAGNPESVLAFVWWLRFGRWPDDNLARLDFKEITDEHDRQMKDADYAVEVLWGRNGPRNRMARLCWQACNPDSSGNMFRVSPEQLFEDFRDCGQVLTPIQERVAQVLRAIEQRKREDLQIGQGAWGEAFWLPSDHAAYLDAQLRRVRYTLIEQESDFEESLEESARYHLTSQVQAIHIPSKDPERCYSGSVHFDGDGMYDGCLVRVEAGGVHWPLVNARDPLSQASDFAWGYPGGGPTALALSLLADAAGGDLIFAREHVVAFRDEVVRSLEQWKPFHLSRREILDWLASHGVDGGSLTKSCKAAEWRLRNAEPGLGRLLARIDRARSQGHLRAQRLDYMAEDFEAALAVDLAKLIERNGTVLICDHCHLPIGVDESTRSARQVGRWRSGRPIYHEWCASVRRRDRQRHYRERLMARDTSFLERERQRARSRRRLQ